MGESIEVDAVGTRIRVWLALSAYQTAGASAGNTNETFADVAVTEVASVVPSMSGYAGPFRKNFGTEYEESTGT